MDQIWQPRAIGGRGANRADAGERQALVLWVLPRRSGTTNLRLQATYVDF